ncbi:SNARE associated Golgi protein [Aphelenchoides avenae]|nr:SNARE associated Golgi protein [Aphelenchus avenae]
MKPEEKAHFKYPRSIDDAKRLGKVLSHYKEQHFYTVMAGVAAVYLMLQSFAIPGSIFLTILSGYLFPFPAALALVCLCSACGAAVCYYLSLMFGRKLVMQYFPERVASWQKEVAKQGENLFNYIVFLRVTPILPNWFINIASPVIDVPIAPFFLGTAAGVAPPSFLFIQAGKMLETMTNTNAVWSWSSVGMLGFFAVLSLLPVVYKHYKVKLD